MYCENSCVVAILVLTSIAQIEVTSTANVFQTGSPIVNNYGTPTPSFLGNHPQSNTYGYQKHLPPYFGSGHPVGYTPGILVNGDYPLNFGASKPEIFQEDTSNEYCEEDFYEDPWDPDNNLDDPSDYSEDDPIDFGGAANNLMSVLPSMIQGISAWRSLQNAVDPTLPSNNPGPASNFGDTSGISSPQVSIPSNNPGHASNFEYANGTHPSQVPKPNNYPGIAHNFGGTSGISCPQVAPSNNPGSVPNIRNANAIDSPQIPSISKNFGLVSNFGDSNVLDSPETPSLSKNFRPGSNFGVSETIDSSLIPSDNSSPVSNCGVPNHGTPLQVISNDSNPFCIASSSQIAYCSSPEQYPPIKYLVPITTDSEVACKYSPAEVASSKDTSLPTITTNGKTPIILLKSSQREHDSNVHPQKNSYTSNKIPFSYRNPSGERSTSREIQSSAEEFNKNQIIPRNRLYPFLVFTPTSSQSEPIVIESYKTADEMEALYNKAVHENRALKVLFSPDIDFSEEQIQNIVDRISTQVLGCSENEKQHITVPVHNCDLDYDSFINNKDTQRNLFSQTSLNAEKINYLNDSLEQPKLQDEFEETQITEYHSTCSNTTITSLPHLHDSSPLPTSSEQLSDSEGIRPISDTTHHIVNHFHYYNLPILFKNAHKSQQKNDSESCESSQIKLNWNLMSPMEKNRICKLIASIKEQVVPIVSTKHEKDLQNNENSHEQTNRPAEESYDYKMYPPRYVFNRENVRQHSSGTESETIGTNTQTRNNTHSLNEEAMSSTENNHCICELITAIQQRILSKEFSNQERKENLQCINEGADAPFPSSPQEFPQQRIDYSKDDTGHTVNPSSMTTHKTDTFPRAPAENGKVVSIPVAITPLEKFICELISHNILDNKSPSDLPCNNIEVIPPTPLSDQRLPKQEISPQKVEPCKENNYNPLLASQNRKMTTSNNDHNKTFPIDPKLMTPEERKYICPLISASRQQTKTGKSTCCNECKSPKFTHQNVPKTSSYNENGYSSSSFCNRIGVKPPIPPSDQRLPKQEIPPQKVEPCEENNYNTLSASQNITIITSNNEHFKTFSIISDLLTPEEKKCLSQLISDLRQQMESDKPTCCNEYKNPQFTLQKVSNHFSHNDYEHLSSSPCNHTKMIPPISPSDQRLPEEELPLQKEEPCKDNEYNSLLTSHNRTMITSNKDYNKTFQINSDLMTSEERECLCLLISVIRQQRKSEKPTCCNECKSPQLTPQNVSNLSSHNENEKSCVTRESKDTPISCLPRKSTENNIQCSRDSNIKSSISNSITTSEKSCICELVAAIQQLLNESINHKNNNNNSQPSPGEAYNYSLSLPQETHQNKGFSPEYEKNKENCIIPPLIKEPGSNIPSSSCSKKIVLEQEFMNSNNHSCLCELIAAIQQKLSNKFTDANKNDNLQGTSGTIHEKFCQEDNQDKKESIVSGPTPIKGTEFEILNTNDKINKSVLNQELINSEDKKCRCKFSSDIQQQNVSNDYKISENSQIPSQLSQSPPIILNYQLPKDEKNRRIEIAPSSIITGVGAQWNPFPKNVTEPSNCNHDSIQKSCPYAAIQNHRASNTSTNYMKEAASPIYSTDSSSFTFQEFPENKDCSSEEYPISSNEIIPHQSKKQTQQERPSTHEMSNTVVLNQGSQSESHNCKLEPQIIEQNKFNRLFHTDEKVYSHESHERNESLLPLSQKAPITDNQFLPKHEQTRFTDRKFEESKSCSTGKSKNLGWNTMNTSCLCELKAAIEQENQLLNMSSCGENGKETLTNYQSSNDQLGIDGIVPVTTQYEEKENIENDIATVNVEKCKDDTLTKKIDDEINACREKKKELLTRIIKEVFINNLDLLREEK